MKLEELISNVESEEKKIIRDYMVSKSSSKDVEKILKDIRKLDKKDLVNAEKIIKLLGYEIDNNINNIYLTRYF